MSTLFTALWTVLLWTYIGTVCEVCFVFSHCECRIILQAWFLIFVSLPYRWYPECGWNLFAPCLRLLSCKHFVSTPNAVVCYLYRTWMSSNTGLVYLKVYISGQCQVQWVTHFMKLGGRAYFSTSELPHSQLNLISSRIQIMHAQFLLDDVSKVKSFTCTLWNEHNVLGYKYLLPAGRVLTWMMHYLL